MALTDLLVAPLAVNGYLWHTIGQIDPDLHASYALSPFFPIGDAASGQAAWENKTYVIFDRMFSFNGRPFHVTKKEHIIYSVKGTEIGTLSWGAAIQTILDREDDAGKDINDWIRSNGGTDAFPVYFHSLRVYQKAPSLASSSENIRDFSVRPYYITDFVIDMEYHSTKSLEDYF